jgi:uncharacterized protein
MHEAITQFAKMLRNLDNCMAKTEAYAKAKNFSADNFVMARLTPDMYPFVKQVQAACDAAKFSAAYLSGKDAPSHPDTETTMTELRARVQTCISHLETFSAKDFEGYADRRVAPKWLGGKWMRGDQYLMQAGLPNFYFHLTTAYGLLRAGGADVGKTDFMGNLSTQG